MGLEALNQLVAEAQVDDLAEMVDQALRMDADVNQAFALLHRLRDSRPMQRCLRVVRADELGVISVSVAQYGAPGFAFSSWATVLATWMAAVTPAALIDCEQELISSPRYKLALIEQGMAIGDAARPLFALDWPALLSRDLEALRQELGVVPVREGPASWMSRPELVAALA